MQNVCVFLSFMHMCVSFITIYQYLISAASSESLPNSCVRSYPTRSCSSCTWRTYCLPPWMSSCSPLCTRREGLSACISQSVQNVRPQYSERIATSISIFPSCHHLKSSLKESPPFSFSYLLFKFFIILSDSILLSRKCNYFYVWVPWFLKSS